MNLHDDDALQGLLLSRKEALSLFGLAAAAFFAPRAFAATPSCVAVPDLTEGPFFVDEHLDRSDIRIDPSDNSVCGGTPLKLTLNISRIAPGGCEPLSGAIVDVWHCDSAGNYSGVDGRGPGRGVSTLGKKFLRGFQTSDAAGRVAFTTIVPGWYPGRAVHIHFKVRTAVGASSQHEFASQFFFDDAFTDSVHATAPYAARGQRNRRNKDDEIYLDGGYALVLDPKKDGDGYAASFDVALQLDHA